jgi:hypothetical protein
MPNQPRKKEELVTRWEAWIDESLSVLGIQRASPLETFHLRPWSRVARCESSAGVLYFKTCEPEFRHEAGLMKLFSDRQAACTPNILGVNLEQGWVLMTDSGLRLREQLSRENWLDHWIPIITRYAELQIDLIPHASGLLRLGVPDRRPGLLADRLESILAQPDMLMLGEAEGLSTSDVERMHQLLPRIRERCARLSQAGIPDSLNHGDLHDANIFLQDGGYVFLDWGDASLTHPFFSLRTAYVSLENTLGFEEDAPIFDRLRDGYLDAWEALYDRKRLTDTFDLAKKLWSLASLLSWHQSLAAYPAQERRAYLPAIPALLLELLAANSD